MSEGAATGPSQPVAQAAAALRAGRAAEALVLLRSAPGNADAVYLRALAHSALGQWDEGDKAFREAVQVSPKPGEVLTNHGNMWRRAGRHDASLRCYHAAIDKPGAVPHLPRLIGLALLSLGQLDEARDMLLTFLKIYPKDVGARNALGEVQRKLGDLTNARASFDEVLKLKPNYAVARANRAEIARLEGDLDEEKTLLEQAVRDAPHTPDIKARLARAVARRGETDEAKAIFNTILKDAPHRADLHAEASRLFWEVGDRDAFLGSYRKLPKSLPTPLRSHMLAEAGALAMRAKLEDEAREFFAKSLALMPNSPAALAGRAMAAAPADRDRLWNEAVSKAPGAPDVRLGFSWYLLNQNRPEEAERILSETDAPGSEQTVIAYDSTAARMLGRDRYQIYYDLDTVTTVRALKPPARYGRLDSFLDAVREALEPLFKRKVAPVDQTLFGGQQTPGSLWDTANPVILELKEAMLKQAVSFWRDLNVPPGHPLYRSRKPQIVYRGAWSVKLSSGGGHTDHIHPAGLFSSANYISVPEEIGDPSNTSAGYLRLGRPNLETIDLPPERLIKPEPGLLVLFPSYMWHGVEAFQSHSDRITTPADFGVAHGS